MKSYAWSDPLGKFLMVTGAILEVAGECGVPVIGLLGQALTVGSDLLSHSSDNFLQINEKTQKTFREFHKKLDFIQNEVAEIKDITSETLKLVADMVYKEKIELIDAAYTSLMNGATDLHQTLSYGGQEFCYICSFRFYLRLFDNFIMELQTIANQYLKPERIMEYLEILKKRDSGDYEKSAAFFKYVIATRYSVFCSNNSSIYGIET